MSSKVPLSTNIVGAGHNSVPVDVVQIKADDSTHYKNALVVVQERLINLKNGKANFSNETYGVLMNQDGAFGGTALEVNDGEDTALWTAQDVVGTKLTAGSTDRANTGAGSTLVDNPAANDIWEFNKGSNQDLTGYVALSMAINVDKDWTSDNIEIYGWDGSAEVGVRLNLADYLAQSTFDVWQNLIIPLVDLDLVGETIQSIRMQLIQKTGGKAPKFYIDDVQFEQSGTALLYEAISPVSDARYHATSLVLVFEDAIDISVANGTVAGINPLQILGVAPSIGIVLQHESMGDIILNESLASIGDMLALGFEIKSVVCDGTTTHLALELKFSVPIIITPPSAANNFTLSVRDDLTGLSKFRAYLDGAVEVNAVI
jgi:hypothetical protein